MRIQQRFYLLILLIAIGLTTLAQNDQSAAKLKPITRAEMIERAKAAAFHNWTCQQKNTVAGCPQSKPYASDFKAGENVTGIPYDWGGFDHPERFDQKIAEGQAAGSHSKHGVTSCTTGLDCSGFVSYCWNQPQKYGTSTIRAIAAKPKYNWFTDMKPGDVFNKAGDHIILFAEYNAEGLPVVYEASGGKGKVVKRPWTWAKLKKYIPLQYRLVMEDD